MKHFLLLCILLWCSLVFSQDKTRQVVVRKSIPLSEIITTLEKHFTVNFSFIDTVINGKTATIEINEESQITTIIKSLESQTRLKFEFTARDLITIRVYNKNDVVSICGYIYGKDNEAVPDVNLYFSSNEVYAQTNGKGYFNLSEVSYDSYLTIDHPEFKKQVIAVSNLISQECLSIFLSENSVEHLDEVVLQEYLAKGISKTETLLHINLDDIDILPGLAQPDILQTIQHTPGVNSPFETAAGLYVRGGIPNQNLVLWNGIKTYHQGHFFGLISAFNPYAAEEVNFSKSGISAQYGDRISGVIDIKTESEVAERFTGGAGINMIDADVVIHTPIITDKLSLQVSARRSYTDILQTFTYNQYADRAFQNTKIADTLLDQSRNDFFYADYNANLIAQISDVDKVEVNTIYSINDLDFRRSDGGLSFNDDLSTENEGYNTSWKHQWNDKFQSKASGYYTKYALNYQFITRITDEVAETESKTNLVRDFGTALDLSYQLSETQSFIGGYHFSNNAIQYAFVSTTPNYQLVLDQDNRVLQTHSLYSEYRYDRPQHLHISAGVRLNHYTQLDQSYIEPRISLQKNISKFWKVNATAEYRSQAVSQIQESVVSDLSLENQVWTLANEEQFPVITSYQFTLGTSFRKNKWLIDLDTYHKQIDDITSLTSGFINPIDNAYHNGESSVFGLDFFLKKRFDRYKTWMSYSYINTRNTFDGINNNESFPGNLNIEHTIKWSHFYKINNFQFSLGWLWHTGKVFTNIERIGEQNGLVLLDFGALNGTNLPVYHRLDFSALYDFKLKPESAIKYQLGLSVLNLYNQDNILNREFRTTNTLNNQFVNSDITGLGVTPNLSFRVFW